MKKIVAVFILISSQIIFSQTTEKYFIKKNKLNKDFPVSSITYYGDDVVMYSSSSIVTKPTEKNNLDFYFGFIDEYGDIIKSQSIIGKVNTKYDEINLAFTKDYKEVYFTRKSKKNHLELYKAIVVSSEKWKKIKKLPFNKKRVSFGYPCLNDEGTMLYFVSNMKSSLGKNDIYKVAILGNNKYGTPENLGPRINTSGNEIAPFIINNTLYFSSEGRGGFGKYDIFSINLLDNNSNALNLGESINSKKDDFSYVRRNDMNMGYFISNRNGDYSKNELYSFQKLINPVTLKNENTTKSKGKSMVKKTDSINETKKNELAKVSNTNTILDVKLRKYIKCQEQLDLINNVYFGLNKSNIGQTASVTLNKVIRIMRKCPEFNVSASSHTDSRASYKYNILLSQRRADAVAEYIMLKGNFSSKNIISVGYGEERLRNKCSNKVKCSEAAHRLNRRTEFEISNF